MIKQCAPCTVSPRLIELGSALFIALCFALLLYLTTHPHEIPVDLEIYLKAGDLISRGEDPYAPQHFTLRHGPETLYYLYPPLLAVLVKPLGAFTIEGRFLVWNILSFLMLAAAALPLAWALCSTEIGARIPRRALVLGLLALSLAFSPIWAGFRCGQVHTLVFFALSIAVWALVSGRQISAGAALAAAAWIKMSPALLILLALKFRQWKALLSFLVCAGMGFGLIYCADPNFRSITYFFEAFPAIESGALLDGKGTNFAPSAVLGLGIADWLTALIRTAPVLVFLSVLMLAPFDRTQNRLALFAIGVCAMLLGSPILWAHHLTWFLIPLAVWCGLRVSVISRPLLIRIAPCAAAFGLLCWYEQAFVRYPTVGLIKTLIGLIPAGMIALMMWLLARFSFRTYS